MCQILLSDPVFMHYVHLCFSQSGYMFLSIMTIIQENYFDGLLHILEKALTIENTKNIMCTAHLEPQQEHAAAARRQRRQRINVNHNTTTEDRGSDMDLEQHSLQMTVTLRM